MINQCRKKQLAAALLLFGLVVALCLSLVLMVAHAHHDCPGAHCPICLHISQAALTLRGFAIMGIFMLLSVAFRSTLAVALRTGSTFIRCPAEHSPVSLRTRMDD